MSDQQQDEQQQQQEQQQQEQQEQPEQQQEQPEQQPEQAAAGGEAPSPPPASATVAAGGGAAAIRQQRVQPWTKRSTIHGRSKDPAMAIAFSPDDSLIAAGFFDGMLSIYDVNTLSRVHELSMASRATSDRDKLPITALAFRPAPFRRGGDAASAAAAATTSLRPLLLICCSDGQWHQCAADTGEILRSAQEESNEIYCCGYSCNGASFATAGRDAWVRVYDDRSGAVTHKWTIQTPTAHMAPLRIYSLQWHLTDPHVVYAGGWSQTVTAFDTRTTRDGFIEPASRKDLFGPVLMGDGMALVARNMSLEAQEAEDHEAATFLTSTQAQDVHHNEFDILTVSHRMEDRLELFDANSMTRIAAVPWPSTTQQFLPLVASASPDGRFLAFGGGGGQGFEDGGFILHTPPAVQRHRAALAAVASMPAAPGAPHTEERAAIERQHELQLGTPQPAGDLRQAGRPVTAVQFGHKSSLCVFGDSGGLLHLFERPTRSHHRGNA